MVNINYFNVNLTNWEQVDAEKFALCLQNIGSTSIDETSQY